ncbi:alpha/beta hydrolase [Neisseria sp. CCUG12390]|uniref:alpha/beta hydrolase n=1 Tax=Neisseria sp. CCUG12390 TaxID=3392035 RepID=UPI003A0FFD6D
MDKHILALNDKTVSVYPCRETDAPLFLTFLSQEESDDLAGLIEGKAALVSIDEPDWEHAFSPWPAPAAFKKASDFSGGAEDYLRWLADTVLSETTQRFALQPQWTALAGYSLGGLFAAYSAYHTTPFSRIASVSGSLWFDGWTEFAAGRALQTPPQKAYFSVGDKEKNAKNPRMAIVEDATRATEADWRQKGIETAFELNSGGHFEQVPQRMAKAFGYLLG